MQLYDSFGPNPRAMRMFLAEKGITIPSKPVDRMKARNKAPNATLNQQARGGEVQHTHHDALEFPTGQIVLLTLRRRAAGHRPSTASGASESPTGARR